MTQMSGQQIALLEQSLTYHAPRPNVLQDQWILQQGLHIVLFNGLAKGTM